MSKNTYNKHHVLFSEALWESSAELKTLRRLPTLIIPMDIPTHAELHKNLVIVPPLDHYSAQIVISRLIPRVNDPVNQIHDLMAEISRATHMYKSDPIQRGLGELAVHALETQLPYIREGYVKPS